MAKLNFWIYSAIMYSVLTFFLSFVIGIMYQNTLFGFVFIYTFWFGEFSIVLVLTWLVLQRIMEFRARSIILITSILGWFPATLLLAWTIQLTYPNFYPSPYLNFSYFLSMGVGFSLSHSVLFSIGGLVGTVIGVSYGDRLKRRILFAASRGENTVDLLKLAVSLKDDPLHVRTATSRLIKEGHIVGYVDNTSDQLHISSTGSVASGPSSSVVPHSEGLVREYNIFKSLLKDLEELRRQDRINSVAYGALREEYESKLRQLESALRKSPD